MWRGRSPLAALQWDLGQLCTQSLGEDVAGPALPRGGWGSPTWPSLSSAGGEDDGSCEVNGRRFRDGETFQPHCRVHCRCEDGGFTCVPLCSEDIRLPSWDCPHPRRVEVPGQCCPEWVCDQAGPLGGQPFLAQGKSRATWRADLRGADACAVRGKEGVSGRSWAGVGALTEET